MPDASLGHGYVFSIFFHVLLILTLYSMLYRLYLLCKGMGGLRDGGDDENRPMNMFFIIISCFTYSNYCFLCYIGSIYCVKGREGLGMAAATKMVCSFFHVSFFHTNNVM
jgi:hypothetical protein